eukprot:TRINITY_DN6311_c0_g1_i2.p1 TRINITY_DN6311_c0_g1~~TRINITY_DN6311_c0_g1_i2.p1  ORF type:complete len:600 (-),score=143.95 TRINITY_DN6311_c0_g1_i2:174-1973(-)
MIPTLSSSPGTNNAATQAHDIARQAEAALSRGRFEEAVSLHRHAANLYQQATLNTSNPESKRALNLLASAQNSKASELERLLCPTPTSTQSIVPPLAISTTPQDRSSKLSSLSPRSLSSPNFSHTDFYYSQQQQQQRQDNINTTNNYQHSTSPSDSPLPSPSSSSSSSTSNCVSPHSRSNPNAPIQVPTRNDVSSNAANPLASSMYEEENVLFVYPYNSEHNNETISSLSESTELSTSQHLSDSSTAEQIFLLCSKDRTNNSNNSIGMMSSSPPSPESSRFWLGLEKLLDILPKPIFGGQKYSAPASSNSSESSSDNLNDKSSLMNSFYMVPSSTSSHKTTPTTPTQNLPQSTNTQSSPTSQLKDSGNIQPSNLRGSGTISVNEDQLVKLQRENKHLQHVVELLNAQLSKGAQVKKENDLLKQSILQFREEVQRKASLSRSVLYPSSSSSVVPNNTTSSSSSCMAPSFGNFSSSVPVPIIDNNSRERERGNLPSSSPAHPQLFPFSPSSSPQSPSPPIFKTEVPQSITAEQRIKALEERVASMSRELEEKDTIIRMYETRWAKLNVRKSNTHNTQSQSTLSHSSGSLVNNTQSLTKSVI